MIVKNLIYWLSCAAMLLFSLSIAVPALGTKGVLIVLLFFVLTVWHIILGPRHNSRFLFISLLSLSILLFIKCYINEEKDQCERINETYQHLIEDEST